jgi:hypothetical protein
VVVVAAVRSLLALIVSNTSKKERRMDDNMMNALLKTYGAPNTVKNANAARSFFASNPEIAEKRAMGLRGSGLDDNSDVFGAQLDKLIADSDPQGTVTVGQPEKVIDTVANATTPNAPRKKVETGRGAAPTTEPPPGTIKGATANAGGGGSWLDDLWPALLGLAYRGKGGGGSGGVGPDGKPLAPTTPPEATYAGRMPSAEQAADSDPRALAYRQKQIEPPNKQIPYVDPRMDPRGAKALEDNISDLSRIKTNEPPATVVTGDPGLTNDAKKLQLQAEIDAENAANKALMDQIMERNMNQKRTQQLGSAARAATGRR